MKSICFFIFLAIDFFIFCQSCQSGDCENGFGIYSFSNGDVFRGNWMVGKFSGYGEYYYSNGAVSKGNWVTGIKTGQVTYYDSNGNVQVANWANGIQAQILSTTYGNQKPGGCVSGNCQNGYGKYIYSNGTYEGNFSNGQWKGKGKNTTPNGDVYEGDYNGFIRSGYGVFTWAKGTKYEGNWVDGKAEGQGTYYYLDGSRYSGNFSNYVRSGYGVYYYLDGSVYSGYWANGQRNGQGKHDYLNGTIEEGLFENGKFLGTVTQKQINSTVQNNTKLLDDVITEAPKQNCTYKFIKPTNLTYNYIDNRKDCCYCRSRYATYSLVSNTVNSEQAIYLAEKLYLHFRSVGADENHKAQDFSRYKDFMKVTYPGFENLFLGMMAELSIPMFLFYDIAGKTFGSTVREINKYKVESNFCSPKCKDDCSYSSSCKCD